MFMGRSTKWSVAAASAAACDGSRNPARERKPNPRPEGDQPDEMSVPSPLHHRCGALSRAGGNTAVPVRTSLAFARVRLFTRAPMPRTNPIE